MSTLASLEQLDVRSNMLSELPASFAQLSNLVSLNLADNQLAKLPDALATFLQLRRTHLNLVLAELPFLHSLIVDGNPIALNDKAPLPASMSV